MSVLCINNSCSTVGGPVIQVLKGSGLTRKPRDAEGARKTHKRHFLKLLFNELLF